MNQMLRRSLLALVTLASSACHVSREDSSWSQTTLLAVPTESAARDPAELNFAFWNLENLFDAVDDPANPGDDEFLPAGGWTAERYARKLEHLAGEIATVAPHVIGFAEVENRRVLDDLFAQPVLAGQGWIVVHRDSPDPRGIDVALACRAPFAVDEGEGAVVLHPVQGASAPSRSVLAVVLRAGAARLTVLVNHWPSRGGDKDGAFRALAGSAAKAAVLAAIEREKAQGHDADVLIVGDLNDDPWDASVVKSLGAVRSRNAVLNRREGVPLWNASWSLLAESDVGTLYYNPEWNWNVFDQCIVSRGLLDDAGFRFVEGSLRVHGPDHVRDDKRRPKWFRKGRDDQWTEGYSDHFMVTGRLRLADKP
jgi:hypothetical protein